MTDTEKPLFKLTPQSEGAFYMLSKWVHDEDRMLEDGWEEVSFRYGIAYGSVKVEKVSEVGDMPTWG